MGDLFYNTLAYASIIEVFKTIVKSPQHTFVLLTKRPANASKFYKYINHYKKIVTASDGFSLLHFWPPKNVWLGVTAENQKTADERIPILLDIPAAVRFVSVEPMLSDIDLKLHSYAQSGNMHSTRRVFLNWIIAGTESGPKRRPAKTEWIRSLKDQCVKAGIPFFLKQREIDGKVVKMPEIDGTVYNQYPISR